MEDYAIIPYFQVTDLESKFVSSDHTSVIIERVDVKLLSNTIPLLGGLY